MKYIEKSSFIELDQSGKVLKWTNDKDGFLTRIVCNKPFSVNGSEFSTEFVISREIVGSRLINEVPCISISKYFPVITFQSSGIIECFYLISYDETKRQKKSEPSKMTEKEIKERVDEAKRQAFIIWKNVLELNANSSTFKKYDQNLRFEHLSELYPEFVKQHPMCIRYMSMIKFNANAFEKYMRNHVLKSPVGDEMEFMKCQIAYSQYFSSNVESNKDALRQKYRIVADNTRDIENIKKSQDYAAEQIKEIQRDERRRKIDSILKKI